MKQSVRHSFRLLGVNFTKCFQVMMKETEVAVEEQPSCFYLPCLSSIEYQEAPYQKLKQITMEVLNNSEFFCDSKQL